MTTAGDIIALAMRDGGVLGLGQTANAEDTNDAFTRLNFMVAQWNRQRWLVYHTVDVAKVSTGAQSYSVGPGGAFNVTVRPDRLEAAFFRQLVQSQPNQIDYPLELLQAREDYNNIALKNLTSFPQCIFYDPTYPLGTVYPWPVPQASIYEVHLTLKMVLPEFTSLAVNVNLPHEYHAALLYNLAVKLAIAYKYPVPPELAGQAKEALNILRGANAAIARLTMPNDLVRPGIYNPYSDQIR